MRIVLKPSDFLIHHTMHIYTWTRHKKILSHIKKLLKNLRKRKYFPSDFLIHLCSGLSCRHWRCSCTWWALIRVSRSWRTCSARSGPLSGSFPTFSSTRRRSSVQSCVVDCCVTAAPGWRRSEPGPAPLSTSSWDTTSRRRTWVCLPSCLFVNKQIFIYIFLSGVCFYGYKILCILQSFARVKVQATVALSSIVAGSTVRHSHTLMLFHLWPLTSSHSPFTFDLLTLRPSMSITCVARWRR